MTGHCRINIHLKSYFPRFEGAPECNSLRSVTPALSYLTPLFCHDVLKSIIVEYNTSYRKTNKIVAYMTFAWK